MSETISENRTVSQLKSRDRAQGQSFLTVVLIRKVNARTAKNNNPFLMVEAGDRSGSFQFTCFNDNPVFETLKQAPEGVPVRIRGQIDYFQNRFSPRIVELEILEEEDLRQEGIFDQLVATTTEDIDVLMEELIGLIAVIGHKRLRGTVESVFGEISEDFRAAPAAISMHHAYRGGLLEHTVHMARACRSLLPLYPEVDRDLALSGVLLHDIGKTVEYEGKLVPRRSREGILNGHVVLGYRMVRKAGMKTKLEPDLLERLEHIILSHQGEMEWGAAALASTPEAVFVSMIDNLDARMGMIQQAIRETPAGEPFSDYISGLKAPVFVDPPARSGDGDR